MTNQLSYSQKILQESDFPVKVQYQGHPRVLITLSQVDSLNFTYSHLNECKEYNDSLEKVNSGYETLVNHGRRIESGLRKVITDQSTLIKEEQALISDYVEHDAKQKKKIKRFKFFSQVLGGTTAILLILVLI